MLINRLLKRKTLVGGGQDGDATLAPLDPWVVLYDDLVFGRQIGKGNFGRVFEGTYFGTPVAIKHLFPVGEGLSSEQTKKYVDREIMLLKNLHHPHIVQLIGICEHETGQYIITELVTGGDLKTALARRDPVLTWRQRVMMARDVAYAMNFLHHKGYIHRDLKPDNVLLTEHGRAKVCDLGFARASKKATSYMTIAGSDDYMAPEVLMGDKYDEKCDVFGYGAVLAGIVSRRRPKRNEDGLYGFKLDQFKALIPPDCPKRLSELVLQCCDYDGTKRPSFDQILLTLGKLLDKELKQEPDTSTNTEPKAEAAPERPSLKMLLRSQPQRSITGNLASPPMSPTTATSSPGKLHKMPGMRSMAKDGLWSQFQSVDNLVPKSNSARMLSLSTSTSTTSMTSVDSRCIAPGSGNRERSGSDKSAENSPRNRLGVDLAVRQRSSSEKAVDSSGANSSSGAESAMESSNSGERSVIGLNRRSARSGLQSLWSIGNVSDRSMGWTDSDRSISSGNSGCEDRDGTDSEHGSELKETSSGKRGKREKKKTKKATSNGGNSSRQLSVKDMTWSSTSSSSINTRPAPWVAASTEVVAVVEEEETKGEFDDPPQSSAAKAIGSRVKDKTKERKGKEKETGESGKGSRARKEREKRKSEIAEAEDKKAKGSSVKKSAEAAPASAAASPASVAGGDVDAKPHWVIVEPDTNRERRKDMALAANATDSSAGSGSGAGSSNGNGKSPVPQRPKSTRRAASDSDRSASIMTTSAPGGWRAGEILSDSTNTEAVSSEPLPGKQSLSRRSLSPRVVARMVEREEWEGDDLSSDEMDHVIAQYVAHPNSYAFGASTMQFFGNLKKGGRVQTLIGLFQENEKAAAAAAAATSTQDPTTGSDVIAGTDQEKRREREKALTSPSPRGSRRKKNRDNEASAAEGKPTSRDESSAKESGDDHEAVAGAGSAVKRDSQPPRGKDPKSALAVPVAEALE